MVVQFCSTCYLMRVKYFFYVNYLSVTVVSIVQRLKSFSQSKKCDNDWFILKRRLRDGVASSAFIGLINQELLLR